MDKMSQITGYFKSINYVYLVVLSGNFLALTGDAAIAWPSPVLVKIDSDNGPLDKRPTKDELSWIASMAGFGSFAGVLPFSFLPDVIGRKKSLLLIAIPHIISFLLSGFCTTIEMIYIARFLSGLSISACYIVLPMYVAEISENSNRGLMLVSFAIFSNFGALLSYLTGPYLTMLWFNTFLAIFPIVFFISFLLIAPESPYFYVMKSDVENAKKSLKKLRMNNNDDCSKIEVELENIQRESDSALRNVGDIFDTLTRKYAIKGSLIAVMLTSFQQLSGYAVFIPYTQQIFEEIGSKLDSAVSSIIVGSVAFFASFLCPFIIDRKGRRFVLITSIIGIIFFEIIFGLYYFLREQNYDVDSVKWLPLFCLVGYMLFYTFGLGPLPLTITSEILPVNIKFFIGTLSGLLGTVSSTIMQKKYYDLNDGLGYYGTIWLFALLCSILLIFIIFILPETKGKRFAEILEELER